MDDARLSLKRGAIRGPFCRLSYTRVVDISAYSSTVPLDDIGFVSEGDRSRDA
jgi:hypothetical protein